MPRKTARYVQSLPILEWTDDVYSRDIGVVTVVKGGNLIVGPNTFHWSTPLDLTYQGCSIKRAEGSKHVTMRTADGEAYCLRYDVVRSCWYRDSEYDQVILCDWWHAPGLWEEVQAGGWVLGVLFYFFQKAFRLLLGLIVAYFVFALLCGVSLMSVEFLLSIVGLDKDPVAFTVVVFAVPGLWLLKILWKRSFELMKTTWRGLQNLFSPVAAQSADCGWACEKILDYCDKYGFLDFADVRFDTSGSLRIGDRVFSKGTAIYCRFPGGLATRAARDNRASVWSGDTRVVFEYGSNSHWYRWTPADAVAGSDGRLSDLPMCPWRFPLAWMILHVATFAITVGIFCIVFFLAAGVGVFIWTALLS